VLKLSGRCPAGGGELVLDYRLLFDLDALHRGLLRLGLDGLTQTAVFAPERGSSTFAAGEVSRLRAFGQYLVEGIWHIWIGFDHILFLLSLLLPAVLVHEARRWRGVAASARRWSRCCGWSPPSPWRTRSPCRWRRWA
jgi:hypothetical protein